MPKEDPLRGSTGVSIGPYCRTSHTIGSFAFSSPEAATPSATQMTLVVAEGEDWGNAAARAEMAVACVVREITDVGLKVAAQKTEALYFCGSASGKPPRTHIRVTGTRVLVGDRLKYVGLLLDGRWRFGPHFEALASLGCEIFGRVRPNLGGTDGRVRLIYMGTVNSVALYGAPV